MSQLFVITGGPCSGKTTTIERLSRMGFKTVPEAARAVILEQKKSGGKLPWTDLDAYQRMVLGCQLRDTAGISGAAFVDRGIPDGIAYYIANGREPSEEILAAARNVQYAKVFMLEMLPQHEKDSERVEAEETAKKIHAALRKVYSGLGYDIVKVPVMEPRRRAEFILEKSGLKARK